jgi:HSF-type DNA-binding
MHIFGKPKMVRECVWRYSCVPWEFYPDIVFLAVSEWLKHYARKIKLNVQTQISSNENDYDENQAIYRNFLAGVWEDILQNENISDMMTLGRPRNLYEVTNIIEANRVNFALQSLLASQMTPPSFNATSNHELLHYLRVKFVNECQGADKPSMPIDPFRFPNHSHVISNLDWPASSPLLSTGSNMVLSSLWMTALKNNILRSPFRSTETLPVSCLELSKLPSSSICIPNGFRLFQELEAANSAQSNFESFPMKLHRMLKEVEKIPEHESIVRFLPNGESFELLDISRFEANLMKSYFPRMKGFASFQRQLNLYKFRRVSSSQGVYHHPYFHRDYPSSCLKMKRSNAKSHVHERTER